MFQKPWAILAFAGVLSACAPASVGVRQAATLAPLSSSAVSMQAIAAVQAERQAKFLAHDANRDGQWSSQEWGGPLGLADANSDGVLGRAEWEATLPPLGVQAEGWVRIQASLAQESAAEGLEGWGQLNPVALGGPPVVLLPGYLDLESYFILIKRRLEGAGRAWAYLDLFPNVADIHGAAKRLDALVERTRKQHGASQVDLLGHSMGGLISRTYLKSLGGVPKVRHLVTMATPHHGTYISHLGPGSGADQMNPGSDFMKWLNSPSEKPLVPTTSIRAGLDEIVIPHDSAILEGAENHLARFAMHGTILASRSAWGPAAKALALTKQP